MVDTLFPHTPTMVEPRTRSQGRSKKPLRMKVKFDGSIFIARFEGRPGVCFAQTEKEATYNLRAGAHW